jgi:hypothetical protein
VAFPTAVIIFGRGETSENALPTPFMRIKSDTLSKNGSGEFGPASTFAFGKSAGAIVIGSTVGASSGNALDDELISTVHFSGACFVLAVKRPDTVVKISDKFPVNG